MRTIILILAAAALLLSYALAYSYSWKAGYEYGVLETEQHAVRAKVGHWVVRDQMNPELQFYFEGKDGDHYAAGANHGT